MTEGLEEKLTNLRVLFQNKLTEANQTGDFDTLYLTMFSKTNGEITKLLKTLPTLGIEEKKKAGPLINAFIEEARSTIEQTKAEYLHTSVNDPLIDLTLPANTYPTGNLHPITIVTREINEFFRYYGYSVYEGPDIEKYEYNFQKLNLPLGHPATDLQDSLYLKEPDVLLRTHTSSIEARLLSINPNVAGATRSQMPKNRFTK
jgi:phenylalanyl-tRNA synthetase alpha chain